MFTIFGCNKVEDDADTNSKVPVPKEPGIIGKEITDSEKLESYKKEEKWVAIVGKDKKEVYLLEQYLADINVLFLSNMSPNQVILKKDSIVFKENKLWEIISSKLLYRKALEDFKVFDEELKDDTFKFFSEEAKGQYLLLMLINLPIKIYEPNENDKIKYFKEREDIYTKMGATSYKDVVNLLDDYRSYYIKKVNENYVLNLSEKFEHKFNEEVLEEIKKMDSVDAILDSEYANKTILTINENSFDTTYFGKFLLLWLTRDLAKSMKTVDLSPNNWKMESAIETISQSFLRHQLLLEEFKLREKDFDENIVKRFANLYIESRIADLHLRKTIDRRVPTPLPRKVDKYYEKNKITVTNYFWQYFPEEALTMKTEEDREWYIKNVIAKNVLHDENIRNEQKAFTNSVLKTNNYEINQELLKKITIDELPFDGIEGKNPSTLLKKIEE